MSGERWTEWEQPWTRAEGSLRDYMPMTGPPVPGHVVAVRQDARPYLPTFAPWWCGLLVASVDDVRVTFENAPNFVATLDRYPISTHWAKRLS